MVNYDVIVIGAGNGGLAAAATLTKKRIKTLVLEKTLFQVELQLVLDVVALSLKHPYTKWQVLEQKTIREPLEKCLIAKELCLVDKRKGFTQ